MDGTFIVFEGIDGCGKGTQAKMLVHYLFDRNKYMHVLLTREPGNSRFTREVREMMQKGTDAKANALVFTDLFVLDRKHHIDNIILPVLEYEGIVVSDRYKHSTLAYQQTQGMPLSSLMKMHGGMPVPDITFLLDLPAEEALKRVAKDKQREYKEVFEQLAFQEELRQNYLVLKRQLPDENICVIDATRPALEIFEQIKGLTELVLKK